MKNIYARIWLRLTIWMIEHDKFDYSNLSDREIRSRLKSYKQGWPWVDANIAVLCRHLDSLK